MIQLIRGLFKRDPKIVIPPITAATRELKPDERLELETWLKSPLTQFALSYVEARRPTLFLSNTGPSMNIELDDRRLVHRTMQIQGWDLFRHAISVIHVPPSKLKEVAETYQVNPET